MIDIKDIQGNVIYSTEINKGAKKKFQLMKEDYITLPFSLAEPKKFELGCYVDIDAGLFEVVDAQKPALNASTGGYDYQLRLDAYYWKWKNKIFKYTPHNGGQEASWSITATLDVHLGIFIDNLNALGYKYRGTDFEFSIDSTVENSAKALTYENVNMIDALSMLAEAWSCEWWITDNIIHFGRCEYGTPVDFEIGVNVAEMSRTDSGSDYATRLYVFGSTRNLPANYRPIDENVVVNGAVQRRLMLPSPYKYIDAYEGMSQEEAIEEVVILEDVYPKTDGNISEVSTYESTVENEDGTTTTETFYRFKDNGIKFSKDYILEGEELRVKFTSGSLNGMEFGLVFNPNGEDESKDEAQLFEVVASEDYGRKLPDAILYPNVGDKYILIGWDSTKIADLGLVSKAEEELYQEGLKLSAKRKIDPNTYRCKMFSDYMYGLDPNGKQDSAYSKHFEVGDRVNLINAAYFDNGRQSRIIGYEYNLDIPFDSPTYTVGETASYSRLGALESKLDALTYGGQTYTGKGGSGVYVIGSNDGTAPTDRNVYSALRSDKSYLSKNKDDRSKGKISSDKGFEAGQYVKGFLGGSGAWIGADGYGEMSGLTLREFLEVPELRFNRIDVVSGELWNSIAFGLVEKVDEENQLCWIKLEENERCGLHVDDFCRGIFADFGDGSKSEGVDENGFQHLYGFKTAYFTPKEIVENQEGLFCFEYELCPDTNVHPCASMKFAVYGNKMDASRRASAYSTRTYKRYLNGVDDWVIDPDKHIYAQYGDLNGLTIGGVEMKGYGSFQSNAYFRGVQIQLPPEQLEELRGESAYSVVLSSYNDVVTIDANGNMGNAYEVYNVVTNGDNVVTNGQNVVTSVFKLKTNVQVKKGSKALYYSIYEAADSYTLSINPVGCEAVVTNGVVIVSKVTDTNNCYVNIQVVCEGKATYNLVYRVTFVKDGKVGEDGKNGADGVSYRIEPNIQTVSKTMTGSLDPESASFIMYAYRGGDISVPQTSWTLYGRDSASDEWTRLTGQYASTSRFQVSFVREKGKVYKFYKVTARTLETGISLGDDKEITVVADGSGEKGDKGVMARYRGEFVFYNESDPYVYNDEYRDIVLYDGNVFQVYKYGDSVTDPPTVPTNSDNDGRWQIANKMRFVAMDTALIDNANIGGFTFARKKYINGAPVGVMRSQYGPICISSVDKAVSSGTRVGMTINNLVTKYVTIRKFKSAVYELVPSTLKLIRRKNDNGEYVHETSSVSCSVKTTGTGGLGYTLKYSKDGGSEYTGNTVSTSGVTSNITFILYSDSQEVGRQTIPVLDEGSSAIKAIVEKETLCLKVEDGGKVESGLPFRCKVTLWKGAEEISITSLNMSCPDGVDAANELIEMDTESGTLKCLNAVVKGEVNATSGNIGGFTLSGNQFLSDFEHIGMRKVVSISPEGVNMNTYTDSVMRSEVEIGTYTGAAVRSTAYGDTAAIHAVNNNTDGYAFRADGKSAFFGDLIPMKGINFTNGMVTNGSTISSSISFGSSGSIYLPKSDEPFGTDGQVLIVVNYNSTGTLSVSAKTNNAIYSQRYPSGTSAVSLAAGEMGLFVKRGTSEWCFGRFSS